MPMSEVASALGLLEPGAQVLLARACWDLCTAFRVAEALGLDILSEMVTFGTRRALRRPLPEVRYVPPDEFDEYGF